MKIMFMVESYLPDIDVAAIRIKEIADNHPDKKLPINVEISKAISLEQLRVAVVRIEGMEVGGVWLDEA